MILKKHYIYLLSFLFIFFSCSKEDENEDDPYIPIDEITASAEELIPDKGNKTISTTLTFKNLDDIEYLNVKKNGGDGSSFKIYQKELSESYTLEYTINEDDPEQFNLLLNAHYKNGIISKTLSLKVDNRWGFFIRKVSRIARVTGTSMAGEPFPNPNNTGIKWDVGGTDLGVIWEMRPGKYGAFFGDTFGNDFLPNTTAPGPNGGNWRSNVLAFSEDTDLDDGMAFSSMAVDKNGKAREIIYSGKDGSGNGNWTSIPTAAIRANGADYVHYFNMKNWTGWVTNYSGMYKSVDDGQNWTKCENVSFGSNSPFGQVGYFKKDGFVYMIGTMTGRDSNARLARFIESDIENIENYEYWNGDVSQWVKGDENQATNIFDDKVGELSFIYNESCNKWIIAYFNSDRYNITMRTATQITGLWSEPYELASGIEYPQLYGSYFHPLSVEGDNLYFLMSMWMPYNVFLMKVELGNMGSFQNKK